MACRVRNLIHDRSHLNLNTIDVKHLRFLGKMKNFAVGEASSTMLWVSMIQGKPFECSSKCKIGIYIILMEVT